MSEIFKRLSGHAEAGGTVIADADKPRWVKRLNEQDAELMAKAEVKTFRKITRQMRAVQFEHEERRYFAFFGFPSVDKLPNGLPAALTELVFGIAVTQTDISPKGTPSEIREIIEARYQGVDGYAGYELDEVAELFPRLLVAEADMDHKFTADIDRVLGAMVAVSYIDGPLALSENTMNAVASLFAEGSEFIPFENVLQGLLSISWAGFYVELYRCIEQLYAMPRLLELTKEWKTDKPLGELTELLEKRLPWRPKEDEALFAVISGGCQGATVKSINTSFGLTVEPPSLPNEVAGRAIYKMRNGLVHFRGRTKIQQPTDEKWDAIIAAMLNVVADVYEAFGKAYHEFVAPSEPEAAVEMTALA